MSPPTSSSCHCGTISRWQLTERPSASGCTDKETAYIEKMKAKGADAIAAQLKRLDGMKGSKMAKEQKAWLMQRLNILNQL